jgi:hypothetical protein
MTPRTSIERRDLASRWRLSVAGAIAIPLAGTCASIRPSVEGAPGACEGCTRFETRHEGSPPEAIAVFAEAERVWSRYLLSSAPIRIRVTFTRLEAKATTISNPINGLPGVLPGDTWYPMALADALAGRDLAPRQDDMQIFFSDAVRWSFDPHGEVPSDRVDFLSVAIHEIAHGLGFASLMRFAGGRIFYELEPGERFPPLSFDVPDLKGAPAVFDRFIETGAGERVMEIASERTRSVTLGRAVLDGALYFGGENAVRRAGGRRPRLAVFDPSHVDPGAYDGSAEDALMTPKALPGRATWSPGPIVLGVLEDLGWRIRDAGPAASGPPSQREARSAGERPE